MSQRTHGPQELRARDWQSGWGRVTGRAVGGTYTRGYMSAKPAGKCSEANAYENGIGGVAC